MKIVTSSAVFIARSAATAAFTARSRYLKASMRKTDEQRFGMAYSTSPSIHRNKRKAAAVDWRSAMHHPRQDLLRQPRNAANKPRSGRLFESLFDDVCRVKNQGDVTNTSQVSVGK